MDQRIRKTALYGLMIALAILMSYVESQVPAFFAVPGMKLGLTNIVVLMALYLLGPAAAIVINLVRVGIVGLLFGTGLSLVFSLAGAVLSGLTMILLKKHFHRVVVSVAGGVMHNVGQILVAMAVLSTARIAWYLMILWFSGMASGALIGLLGSMLVKYLEPAIRRWEKGESL